MKLNRKWTHKSLTTGTSLPGKRGAEFHSNSGGFNVRVIANKEITPARARFETMIRTIESSVDGSDNLLPCMQWVGAKTFRVDSQTIMTPRRFIWWDTHGEKLSGEFILQASCKTLRCVNPGHLIASRKIRKKPIPR